MPTETKPRIRTSSNHDLTASLTDLSASWRDRAACKGLGFLMDPQSADDQDIALAICRSCPVRTPCKEWVLGLEASLDPGGVCGGITELDRPVVRANRARALGRAAREDPATAIKAS